MSRTAIPTTPWGEDSASFSLLYSSPAVQLDNANIYYKPHLRIFGVNRSTRSHHCQLDRWEGNIYAWLCDILAPLALILSSSMKSKFISSHSNFLKHGWSSNKFNSIRWVYCDTEKSCKTCKIKNCTEIISKLFSKLLSERLRFLIFSISDIFLYFWTKYL